MKLNRTYVLSIIFLAVMAFQSYPAQSSKIIKISKPVKLMPHRAVYDISLVSSTNSSGISGIRGRLVFELTGSSCDGYTVNMRFVTQITDQHGNVNVSDLRTSSWESGTGDRFRFNSSEYSNTKLKMKTSGDAQRSKDYDHIQIRLKRPEKTVLSLPSNVLFPTQHNIQLIETALKGKNVFQADLYDGSEKGEKVYATTAIIGKKRISGNQGLNKVDKSGKLGKAKSWPVSIGYFDKDTSSTLPSYQIAFRLFENGVSRKLFIDYGKFTIKGTLKKIDFLPQSRICGK